MGAQPATFAAIAAICLTFSPALARTEPAPVPTDPLVVVPPPEAPDSSVSLSHSALKAATYKTATTAANFTILSIATGGVVAGATLTAVGAAASLVVYAVNDYAWESRAPAPAKQEENQPFDAAASFWRTGENFLTYKAATVWIKAAKLATLYAYTGSPVTTLAAIGTSTVVNAGLFFANGFAWDYYNWSASPPARPAPADAPQPEADPVKLAAHKT